MTTDRRFWMTSTAAVVAACAGTALLTACEEDMPQGDAYVAPEEPETQEKGDPRHVGGTSSALGKAKQSAANTVDRVEQRDRDLGRMIDDMNE